MPSTLAPHSAKALVATLALGNLAACLLGIEPASFASKEPTCMHMSTAVHPALFHALGAVIHLLHTAVDVGQTGTRVSGLISMSM